MLNFPTHLNIFHYHLVENIFRFPFWFLWSAGLGIIYLSVLFTNKWRIFLYIFLLIISGFFLFQFELFHPWFPIKLALWLRMFCFADAPICTGLWLSLHLFIFSVRLILTYEFWGADIRCMHIYDVIMSLVHWYRYKLPSLGAGDLNTGPFACKPNALTHWAMSPAALLG